jgi:hypothetical protein
MGNEQFGAGLADRGSGDHEHRRRRLVADQLGTLADHCDTEGDRQQLMAMATRHREPRREPEKR